MYSGDSSHSTITTVTVIISYLNSTKRIFLTRCCTSCPVLFFLPRPLRGRFFLSAPVLSCYFYTSFSFTFNDFFSFSIFSFLFLFYYSALLNYFPHRPMWFSSIHFETSLSILTPYTYTYIQHTTSKFKSCLNVPFWHSISIELYKPRTFI